MGLRLVGDEEVVEPATRREVERPKQEVAIKLEPELYGNLSDLRSVIE